MCGIVGKYDLTGESVSAKLIERMCQAMNYRGSDDGGIHAGANPHGFQGYLAARMVYIEHIMYVIIAGIFGLIGFVVWDRRNATKPVRQDIDRLFQVMRKLAEKDQKIAEVLRSVGLL